jgi:hypothetical protein
LLVESCSQVSSRLAGSSARSVSLCPNELVRQHDVDYRRDRDDYRRGKSPPSNGIDTAEHKQCC